MRIIKHPVEQLMKMDSTWSMNEVVQMQDSLQQLGYLAAVTGYYDDATVAAVRSFQSRNGLSVDGSAGQETLAVLYGRNPRAAY